MASSALGPGQFTTEISDRDPNIYEIKGSLGANLSYVIKYTKVHAHHIHTVPTPSTDQFLKDKDAADKKAAKGAIKAPPPKSHRYSTGLQIFQKAIVKRIPCDQLYSLTLRKDRSVGNKERRNMVIRKLHEMGGWVRMGRHKDRTYVEPNSPLPEHLQQKPAVQAMSSFDLATP